MQENPRKMAYSANAKRAVLKMYSDGMPLREIEREFGIDRKVIREWKRRFEEDGMDGLEKRHYRCTDYETRCAAVRDYLENGQTYTALIEKYGIARAQLKYLVAKVRKDGYEALKEKRRGRPPKVD